MESITIVLNCPPIGTEKAYNALRYATALAEAGLRVNLFLMGDGVLAAKQGKKLPSGYPNVTDMLSNLMEKGVELSACATCCAARGFVQEDLLPSVEIANMQDLARLTQASDSVVLF
jgi:sulfur relay (sulfurtransferase) complex TusBCD TusD component (DsrE family)